MNNVGNMFGLPTGDSNEKGKEQKKVALSGLAEMFGEQKETETKQPENNIVEIALNNLQHFKDHPFSLHEGKRKQDLVNSIKEHGILSPVIVREKENGYYEILAGHNRVEAGREAGLEKVPCIILRDITEEEAMLIVVESNLMQRSFHDLKESEKATVLWHRNYAMTNKNAAAEELEEIKSFLIKAEKDELSEERSRDKVGREYDLSGRTIARYLRVYECHQSIKDLLDDGKIGIYVAVAISYISKEMQDIVAQKIESGSKINIEQAKEIKNIGSELTKERIDDILDKKKNTEKEKIKKGTVIILNTETSQKYFEGKKEEEVAEIIEKALEKYFNEGIEE